MKDAALRLGTRGSPLALAQSRQFADQLAGRHGVPVELEIIRTRGDQVQDRPLAEVGGKGLFTAELEEALRSGRIDFAVHSLKDLPTEDPEGLCVGAIPARADPRDTLVGAALDALPAGAVVGTGSLRRHAQLAALRPDLDIRGIRGNVDTRLHKRDSGGYDAVVLAMAGLTRLGISRPDIYPLSPDVMVPAVGQGALAVQCRSADERVQRLLSALDDAATRRCVEAERAFLVTFGGGCNVPVACHAVLDGDDLVVTAVGPAGERLVVRGPDGPALGRGLAARLQG